MIQESFSPAKSSSGEYVHMVAGMREVWEDGYAFKDLAERQAALAQQRESIEAARKVRESTEAARKVGACGSAGAFGVKYEIDELGSLLGCQLGSWVRLQTIETAGKHCVCSPTKTVSKKVCIYIFQTFYTSASARCDLQRHSRKPTFRHLVDIPSRGVISVDVPFRCSTVPGVGCPRELSY